MVGNQTMASTSSNNLALPPTAATPDDARRSEGRVRKPGEWSERSSFKQHFIKLMRWNGCCSMKKTFAVQVGHSLLCVDPTETAATKSSFIDPFAKN
jgi:hypothetical protein